VGCGGSGGLTLQYLMDQLRADLQPHGLAFPAGWQFVHLDVPAAPDGVGAGRPPTVRQQGGSYVSVGSARGKFSDVADGVVRRLTPGARLGSLVPWMPDPNAVTVPASQGAGQFRAVGRILTLSRMTEIRTELESAWGRLGTGEARAQLTRTAERLSPATVSDVQQDPYVLVVSSMAGGTGASMVIDVCRVLAGIVPDPMNIVVVAHTPEVFEGLAENQRSGVDANAAAMIGELMALQAGAGIRADQVLLRDLGAALPEEGDLPFRRVIPVGSRIGVTMERLGATPDERYRGLGHALAALMLDGTAWERFKKNTLENFGGGVTVDRSVVGWGVDPDRLVWGSLGYASVSLGREKYREYAAQRLARLAADRLAIGHLNPNDDRAATAQLNSLVEQTLWPRLLQAIPMPQQTQEVYSWLDRVAVDARTVSESMVEEARRRIPGGKLRVTEMVDLVVDAARAHDAVWRQRVMDESYRRAWRWSDTVRTRLLERVREVVAEFGLPAARELMRRWQHHCSWLAETLQLRPDSRRTTSDWLPDAGFLTRLKNQKGQIHAQSPQSTELVQEMGRNVHRALLRELGNLLGRVLPDLSENWCRPLTEAISERLLEIEAARKSNEEHSGQAQVHTEAYASWPAGEHLPGRFRGAPNEVELTPVEEYPSLFRQHAGATVSDGKPVAVEDALRSIVSDVLVGRWRTTGGFEHDQGCVEVLSSWRGRDLPFDVTDDGAIHPVRQAAASARFTVTLSSTEALRRAEVYLSRPGEPFHCYVAATLRDYLTDESLMESEREQRCRRLVDAMIEAMSKAQPMVAVDARKAERIHDERLSVYYSFSALPVAGTPAAQALTEAVAHRDDILHPLSDESLSAAIKAGLLSRATRIHVHGSYPNLSPVVLTSLLQPVTRRWARCGQAADRVTFWQWKRARRLPGALPVGDAARKAMIRGWFVGRFFGLVGQTGTEQSSPIYGIYDIGAGTWVTFPMPMPLPGGRPGGTGRTGSGLDNLAAVLEAMPIALAECANAAQQSPFLPLRSYDLLRKLGDDGLQDPSGDSRWARDAAAQWINAGHTLSGTAPEPDHSGPQTGTPDERRAVMADYLGRLEHSFAHDYLESSLGGQTGGRYSRIGSLEAVLSTPRFHEVAADALDAVRWLSSLIDVVGVEIDEIDL
jgi:hypothetical protein